MQFVGCFHLTNDDQQEHYCISAIVLVTRGYCESTIPSLLIITRRSSAPSCADESLIRLACLYWKQPCRITYPNYKLLDKNNTSMQKKGLTNDTLWLVLFLSSNL